MGDVILHLTLIYNILYIYIYAVLESSQPNGV